MTSPRFIPKLQTIAGLVSPTLTKMWVTSANWGLIAQELEEHYLGPEDTKPSRGNFARLKLGSLTVINSGTEDEEVCQLLNEPEFERARFQESLERCRSLYGTAANAVS